MLEHKSYEDNGIVYTFFSFSIQKNKLFLNANAQVPEGMGWNEYMLEFFAYNIINEKIMFMNSSGLLDVVISQMFINDRPVKGGEYYLPVKLETKLENLLKKIPDFGISYSDFGVMFEVDKKMSCMIL